MPVPAISINSSLSGVMKLKDPWGQSTNTQTGWKRVVLKRPATISNPIQPDGTRRMRAWSNYGGRWSGGTASGQFTSSWYTVYLDGQLRAAPIDPSQLKVWVGGANAAKLKAMASWADREVQYSNALRQSGQTARMVGDLGKGMANELGQLMDKGLKGYDKSLVGKARQWKKLPGWYLEWLYGWKPLMDDISNVTQKLIRDVHLGDTMYVTLTGRWKGRSTQVISSGGGVWGAQFNVDSTLLLEQTDKCVMKYNFPIDRLPNLEPIGFFGGLWEGAPYSFVLDWIAPVGSWLTALDANALAIYFDEGCTSTMVRCLSITDEHVNRTGIPSALAGYATQVAIPPYNFRRKIESPWSLTTRVPIRWDLNLQHAAQGLSLLTQALRRLG